MTPAALSVRRYRETDSEEVQSLHHLALEGTGADLGPGPWVADLDDITSVYLDAQGEFLVGLVDDHIVAMGALRRIDARRAELKRMRVHPDYQRRGFGRAMLDRLEARARELGYQSLELDTTVQQVAAQELYTVSGYTETGRGRGTVGAFDVIRYEKAIGPAH